MKKKLQDPKANAHPDLSYGGSSLSVGIETDDNDNPQKLTLQVEIELPVATKLTKLDQDLLAACRTVEEASKYLKDRADFFKSEIRARLQTKGCKQEAGFLTGQLSDQNSKDWSWKNYALKLLTKLTKLKRGCSQKEAETFAKAQAEKEYAKAPIKKKDSKGKKIQPKVSVKGVILDA